MNIKTWNSALVITREGIKQYLKAINKFPILSEAQESTLFDEYYNEETSETRRASIKKAIIESHLKFAFSVAQHSTNSEDVLEDLISVGAEALDMAFEKYDRTKGTKFITTAIFYLRREYNKYMDDNKLIVSNYENITSKKIKQAKNNFFLANGRDASDEELLEILETEYNCKLKSSLYLSEIKIDSIDYTSTDDEAEEHMAYNTRLKANCAENMIDTEDQSMENSDMVNRLFACLNEREARIVSLVRGLNEGSREMNFAEAADVIGLCPERVRQLYTGAINKMRKLAAATV